jgi:transcriptional regulator with XRE-family HTH domain
MTPLHVRIGALRDARGWTIDELAERSGVHRSTIIRLEQRHTVQVRLDVLEKLAAAFGESPGSLIQEVPKGKR